MCHDRDDATGFARHLARLRLVRTLKHLAAVRLLDAWYATPDAQPAGTWEALDTLLATHPVVFGDPAAVADALNDALQDSGVCEGETPETPAKSPQRGLQDRRARRLVVSVDTHALVDAATLHARGYRAQEIVVWDPATGEARCLTLWDLEGDV